MLTPCERSLESVMAAKDKDKLKQLREERKAYIQKAKEMIKEQNKIVKKIKEQLGEGPKTVPEISRQTDLPTWEVMWFIASMKKYGMVAEGDKDGDYFKYELITSGT